MKSLIVLIGVLLLMLPLQGMAQVESKNLLKNGDFEKFNGDEPANWETTNVPGLLTAVSPSKVSAGGAYAVRCEVKDCFGSKIAGMVTQKNVTISGEELKLSGSYVLHSVGKDVGMIAVCFLSTGGSVIETEEELLGPQNSFTAFTKVMKVPKGAVEVHLRMSILPDKDSEKLHEGSYALFDNVKLVGIMPKPSL